MQSSTSPSSSPYHQLLRPRVGLGECPNATPLGKSANITRGDLHGNSVMLMHQLRMHGVIYAPNPDTKMDSLYTELVSIIEQLEFVAINKREAKDPEEKTTKELYDKFKEIIAKLVCDPDGVGLLRSIGDMLADRRGNDVLTLLFFGLLKQFNIPYKIVYSNHDSSFIQGWMGSDLYLMSSDEKKINSDARHLRLYKKDEKTLAYYIEDKEHTLDKPEDFDLFEKSDLYKNGVLSCSLSNSQRWASDILLYDTTQKKHTVAPRSDASLGIGQAASFYAMRKLITKGIITQEEFDRLVKEVYLPHLKLIDYEIDDKTQPPTLSLFTHAPVGFETYKELAKEFKVPYPPEPVTMNALCKMIDGINNQFTERLKTEEGIIDIVKKSEPDDDRSPSLSLPLARITWNREATYGGWFNSKPLELPTTMNRGTADAFNLYVVHGHVGSSDLSYVFSNFVNIDSEFGKGSLKEAGYLITLVTHPTRQPLELTATAAAAKHAPSTAALAAAAAAAVQPEPVKTLAAKLAPNEAFAKALEEAKLEDVKSLINSNPELLHGRYGSFNSPPLVMVVSLAGEALAKNEMDKVAKLYQIAEQYFDHPKVEYNAQDNKGNTLLHGVLNLLTYRNVGGEQLGVKTLKLFHSGPSKVSIDIPNSEGMTVRNYIKANQVRLNVGRMRTLGTILHNTSEAKFPLLAPTAEAKQSVVNMQSQPSNEALSQLFAALESLPPKIEEAKQLLKEHRSLINTRDQKTGHTPLIRIINIIHRFPEIKFGDDGALTPESFQVEDAKSKLTSLRKELLTDGNNNGIKVDVTDNARETALHHAVRIKDFFLVTDLLECRADLKIKNNDGVSPFKLMMQLIEEEKVNRYVFPDVFRKVVSNIPSRAIYTPPPLPILPCVTNHPEERQKYNEEWLSDILSKTQVSDEVKKRDYKDVISILEFHPSLVNMQNAKKETPLIASVKAMKQAVENNKKEEIKAHVQFIEDIINRPCIDVDLIDAEGHTALYYLSLIDYAESSNLILKFLERGANPSLGEQPDTPLDNFANEVPMLLEVAKFYDKLLSKLDLDGTPRMSTSPHSFMAHKTPAGEDPKDQQTPSASKGLDGKH